MEKETIYLDASVPSAYYDERVVWRRDYTREWWKEELPEYDVFISETVIAEIMGTDEPRRKDELLELVKEFSELKLSSEVEEIAKGYVNQGVIPQSQFPDALHVDLASFHKIDFLVTWNCKHLAEAHRRRRVRLFNTSVGLFVPDILTPLELTKGGEENV